MGLLTLCSVLRREFSYTMIVPGGGFFSLQVVSQGFVPGEIVMDEIDTCITRGQITDNGVRKRSQQGLILLEDIDSSTGGFCAILSWVLEAHERSLSFTYGRPKGS